MKVTLLPMVEMWEGWNSLSVNLHNKQVLPTPESPSSRSLNSTSYCLAMVSYGQQLKELSVGFPCPPSSKYHLLAFSIDVRIPRKSVRIKQESVWSEPMLCGVVGAVRCGAVGYKISVRSADILHTSGNGWRLRPHSIVLLIIIFIKTDFIFIKSAWIHPFMVVLS